jgi:hypothetical protein
VGGWVFLCFRGLVDGHGGEWKLMFWVVGWELDGVGALLFGVVLGRRFNCAF